MGKCRKIKYKSMGFLLFLFYMYRRYNASSNKNAFQCTTMIYPTIFPRAARLLLVDRKCRFRFLVGIIAKNVQYPILYFNSTKGNKFSNRLTIPEPFPGFYLNKGRLIKYSGQNIVILWETNTTMHHIWTDNNSCQAGQEEAGYHQMIKVEVQGRNAVFKENRRTTLFCSLAFYSLQTKSNPVHIRIKYQNSLTFNLNLKVSSLCWYTTTEPNYARWGTDILHRSLYIAR